MAALLGVGIGLGGLMATAPIALSLPPTIPLLSFSVRLDALAGFFVLTISLAALSVSIYALGYLREYYGRKSVATIGALYNAFGFSAFAIAGMSRKTCFDESIDEVHPPSWFDLQHLRKT